MKDLTAKLSITRVIKSIYAAEGMKGFYHGMIPSIAGIIPYHGTGFFTFHYLKGKLKEEMPAWRQSPIFDFIFGGFSGILGQAVAYPFDVVRRRMQAQHYLFKKGDIDQVRSCIELTKHIYKSEGIVRGFYKGISVNLIKGPLAVGTSFTVKNAINRHLDKNYSL